MNDYILFMHDDAPGRRGTDDRWRTYFAKLRAAGSFQGGSSIGDGVCISKSAEQVPITGHLSGYIRIRAANLGASRELVLGNPVYEAGGNVEIRELPAAG